MDQDRLRLRENLREDRVHGDAMYPVRVYPDVEQLNGNCILEPHWHEELEFILVEEGSALFQTDMNYTLVRAGEILFVNRGELHAGYLQDDSHCIFSAVVFHPDWLNCHISDIVQLEYIEPFLHKKKRPRAHIHPGDPGGREIIDIIGSIIADHRQPAPGLELMTKGRLYTLLALLEPFMQPAEATESVPGHHEKIERIKQALDYIHAHYQEPLRLKQIADTLHMSEGHFCRFFKQMVQKSPVEYTNGYRIQRACRLLEHSNRKVVDIAMEVGFDNLSYFIATFKRNNGLTPSQYRKLHQ